MCDTCNNLAQEPCSSNTDCPDPAGPIGPICGGRRCINGTNAGAPCTTNTQCPGTGGTCNVPGASTASNQCSDDTNTPTLDCTDDGDGEGTCDLGPVDNNCTAASGHPQRGCLGDGDCGGAVGSCSSFNRKCFLTGGFAAEVGTNTLVAVGQADTPVQDIANPRLGAVFCVGPTGSSSINGVAGLPGPARVTIRGTAQGLP
jgi:hypothetical protein